MYEVAALLQCQLPVIVDDQLRASPAAGFLRRAYLGPDRFARRLLDTQLNQSRASSRQSLDPSSAVDNGIETRERHQSTALPSSGVDGAAISRGSIGPAKYAACPASIALPNAAAICAGSRARATAVLMSTASKPSSIA